jgi:hypothetical protein
MRNLLLSIAVLTSIFTWAQKDIFLNIAPLFGTQPFALNQNFVGNDGIAVNIEHFNYYISDVKIFHDNGSQTNFPTDIWLVTPLQHSIYLGNLNINQLDSINFTVGVPKRYNTQSGALAQDISTYPDSHALSFQSPSMYWGWAFGYMHMIIGGKADSNNDGVPNAYFEMHNLGNNNQQSVTLPSIQTNTGNQIDLNYTCNVDRWLNQLPLSSVGVLHGDAGLNQQILQNVNSQEVFTLAANANTQENTSSLLAFMQTDSEFTFSVKNNQTIKNYVVLANSGQKIAEVSSKESKATIMLEQLQSGIYLVMVETDNGQRQTFRFVKP